MERTDAVGVRPMREDDLECVLAWRNHPEIRRYMLSRHEISLEEHRQWFARASVDPARRLLIVEEAGHPLGYVHFTGVAAGASADWGFYAVPGVERGSGRKIGRAALDYAFGELGLHKVCGQALAFNEASIGFHLRLGFQREGVLREQHCLEDIYHDLICFGLLAREWTQGERT